MALAVNNSLMTLMKMHVFCTEPYRVPIAGKLDAALFDKTGTLTTDELVAVGVCQPVKLKTPKGKELDDEKFLTPMLKVEDAAALVLAGCHSLVYIEGETTGDPLESESLKSMRWQLSQATGNAAPAPATEKKTGGKVINLQPGGIVSEVEVLTRHHFSSKLQRMSCVVKSVSNGKHFAVMKGSPEAVGDHLANKPDGYDDKAAFLSKEGYRVISLGYRPLSTGSAIEKAREARANCESDMQFAGFIAFTCRVRKDTSAVLMRLMEGGLSIAMVTGDALLTAVHVAKEVNIFESIGDEEHAVKQPEEKNSELKKLLESKRSGSGSASNKKSKQKKEFKPILLLDENNGSLHWKSYESGEEVMDYNAEIVPSLSKDYGLATTGKILALALESDEKTRQVLGYFKVFARMTPDAKETVIECLHSVGSLCLMCGDGANDVGALKGADVGVALLSGFGDINVERSAETEADAKKEEEQSQLTPITAIMSQEKLNEIRQMPVALIKMKIRSLGVDPNRYPELIEKEDLVQLYHIKARELAVKRHDQKNANDLKNMSKGERKELQRKDAAEKQERIMTRTAELEAQGVSWAAVKAVKEIIYEDVQKQKRKQGNVKGGGIEGSASALAAQLDDVESGDLPMVKLGDASIAAPFTSKMPSIKSCVDIVRQGRCTLVSSIQMVSTALAFWFVRQILLDMLVTDPC
jgi:cation-transporting ATPase 13A1